MVKRIWRTETLTISNVGNEAGDVKVSPINVGVKSGVICGLQVNCSGGTAPAAYDIAIWNTEHATWASDDEKTVFSLIYVNSIDPADDYSWDGELEFENGETTDDATKSYQLWVGIRSDASTTDDDYEIVLTMKRIDI